MNAAAQTPYPGLASASASASVTATVNATVNTDASTGARPSVWPWRGPTTLLQRWLLAGAALAAAGLLLALVQTCQESMRNGERWRAEQRAEPRSAVAPAASSFMALPRGTQTPQSTQGTLLRQTKRPSAWI